MFDCIFPTFRKNERPPLPIKFLFDFLDDQAKELNITDPEVMHTWKNNRYIIVGKLMASHSIE
jgi:hypothetical protein